MNVFVINLDRDRDRFLAVKQQLESQGVAFERVSAVVGKNLSNVEKTQAVNAKRWLLAVGRRVLDGEIGCAMSHYKIYRQLENGMCCVLEDDVVLDARFREVLEYVEKHVDVTRPQVVLLSNHTGKNLSQPFGVSSQDCALIPACRGLYAEAYVLTAPAARAILATNYPLRAPCDHWTRWVRMGVIELFYATPTVCGQNRTDYESNVGRSGGKMPKRPFMERGIRHLGFGVDRVLLFFERLCNETL